MYGLTLGVGDFTCDADGVATLTAPGAAVTFELRGAVSTDPDNALLPAGEYEPSTENAALSFDSEKAHCAAMLEGGATVTGSLQSVTVEAADEGYELTLRVSYASGEVTYKYTGPIRFENLTQEEPEPEPQTVEFDRSSNAAYFGDLNGAGTGGYGFILCNVALTYDEAGQPVPSAEGTLLQFDLWGPLAADADKAVLPDGEYTLGTDYSDHTFHPDYTYFRTVHADGSRESDNFNAGSVTVGRDGDDYVIEALLTPTKSGEPVKYTFRGPIEFKNQVSQMGLPPMEHNADVTFTVAQGLYFGRKGGIRAESYVLNLYTSAPDENGYPSQPGYMMSIELKTEPSDDMSIMEGVYPIEGQGNIMTCLNGLEMYMFGVFIPAGTYCMEWDGQNGAYGLAASGGGSVTVARSGENYTLTVDFQTTKGYTVHASYTGPIPMEDKSTEDPEPQGPFTTLTDDYQVDLSAITFKEFQYWGDFYKSGTGNWTIRIRRDQGDGMQFELFAPLGNQFPTGTFNMSENKEAYTYLPGIMQNNACTNTWYIQYSADANKAPARSGTVDIEHVEGDTYTISFELYDDAETPHKFYGSWTGEVVVDDCS